MPSAFIPSVLSYPAMPLAEQQVHQRYVQPGPLVLRSALLKFPTPVIDRDRTVSRRSEPSSRTALMGEQPNPWNRIQPQDAMSRHLCRTQRICQTVTVTVFRPSSFSTTSSVTVIAFLLRDILKFVTEVIHGFCFSAS